MKGTGLFFGSFNPIHNGHLIIANYILEYSDLDEIWFVVSPQNPLKKKSTLLDQYERLHMVNLAIEDFYNFRSCDIEFRMPQPSYTIDTLTYLAEKYTEHAFHLIMGSDNLNSFHKWKNFEHILHKYQVIIYPRPGKYNTSLLEKGNMIIVNAPQMDISSSFIRNAIKEKKDIPYFMHPKVYGYIDKMGFYR